jgi:intein/homing endonuclease
MTSRSAQVAVLRTRPETVVEDYGRLMRLAKYDQVLARDRDLILKLNLSWTKYFPACSSQPWQVDGIVSTLLDDGYDRARLFPVENKTVVTNPVAGCRNNRWLPVLERHRLPFIPLPDVAWTVHRFRAPLLRLNEIFPEGIEIPAMYVGKNILHAPTVKCVHPDTEVQLADGRMVRAEALIKEWQFREPVVRLADGDEYSDGEVRIVSLDGSGLGGAHATRFWRTPVADPAVWSIRTRTGRCVTTSARHPFLTPEGWKRADELRIGDRVAIARRVRIEGRSQALPGVAAARAPASTSPRFWRWMGYFIAEGYACEVSGSYRISVANTDAGVREDYIELCRSLFGVEPRCRGNDIYFDALNLQPFFESVGFRVPTNSATKEVPASLFACPDEEIAAFVQAYLDGDGGVGKDGVHATTKSRRLASQIQMLLSRLGVVAFVRPFPTRSTTGRNRELREYWDVAIYGDDVITLSKHVTFRCPHKQRNLEALVVRRRAGKRPSNWDTIPLPPALFRMLRERLGFSHATTGRPSAVNTIENGHTEPTRPVVRYFIALFEERDTERRFSQELAYLRFLASDDIAWDRVDDIATAPSDVPFFYDLSVEGTRCFIGNGVLLHNTHGHSTTTGAIKNSFGGLLKEVRHYAHEFMHEVLVDLMSMQRELHPAVFAVMDGTVMGDGAGPRTMVPRVGNLVLASADQVAIDAIAARIMGFDPLSIRYLRMCQERGLGVADPRDIEILGDVDVAETNMGFRTSRSLVIWGDQLIRRGPLKPLKRLLLHSPLVVWAPFASNVYHDLLWYPTVGRSRIRAFAATPWGRLFETY